MKIRSIIFLLIFCVPLLTAAVPDIVEKQSGNIPAAVEKIADGAGADVGVAYASSEKYRQNGSRQYPLLSVFKLHVAVAVLDRADRENIALDSRIQIPSAEIKPDLYSPLREKYGVRDLSLPLRELLRYMVAESDNNACDILIEYAGGIKHINDYIHQLSIDSFNLSETEDGMHSSFEAVYRNWSTPSAMARLLRTADEKELFSNKELKDFLWQTMIDTETGANKLKGMLPAKTVVGHKTGSSDRNADGMKTADNDAGLVILPDGRKYYIAAFVMDSYETDEDNANIIARISRMVYDAMR